MDFGRRYCTAGMCCFGLLLPRQPFFCKCRANFPLDAAPQNFGCNFVTLFCHRVIRHSVIHRRTNERLNDEMTNDAMTIHSRTFVWLWIAALLTATVGLSVQRIYCYCVGETTVGLFVADDACQMRRPPAAMGCCAKKQHSGPLPSCCKKSGDTADHDENNCTQKTTQVFQWKAEFLVDKLFEKNFDLPAWSDEQPIFRQFLRKRLCEASTQSRPPPAPPPPLSGRMTCVRHQVFRL